MVERKSTRFPNRVRKFDSCRGHEPTRGPRSQAVDSTIPRDSDTASGEPFPELTCPRVARAVIGGWGHDDVLGVVRVVAR